MPRRRDAEINTSQRVGAQRLLQAEAQASDIGWTLDGEFRSLGVGQPSWRRAEPAGGLVDQRSIERPPRRIGDERDDMTHVQVSSGRCRGPGRRADAMVVNEVVSR